jgi:nucleoside-diphosphate-sugar epimerase
MRILITGAAGFVGQILAKKLLDDEESAHRVILTDIIEPPIPYGAKLPQNAKCIKADLNRESSLVVDKALDAVYVFHGIMSSGAEANYELGMKANFDATRALLETLRSICPGVRVIYASSQAVYGSSATMPITETQLPLPETSYGAQKMMCEYLINDYTRRGFINGLTLRFPTVTVRPGKPTAAASSFISGMIREPMNGVKCQIPLTDRTWRHWLCSPRTLVRNLVFALSLDKDALPNFDRSLNHPGIGVSLQDMRDSLARVGGEDKLALLEERDDPVVKKILYSWPADFDNAKAVALGFARDVSYDDIVRNYQEELTKTEAAKGQADGHGEEEKLNVVDVKVSEVAVAN